MKRTDNNGSNIVCELSVGEHLIRIHGLDHGKAAYDYEVLAEHPYHYIIGMKYIANFASDSPKLIYTSVSKAAIYCGDIVLLKEDGSKVRAYEKLCLKKTS